MEDDFDTAVAKIHRRRFLAELVKPVLFFAVIFIGLVAMGKVSGR